MPTLRDLTDEIISQLHGHVDLPLAGTLVDAVDAVDGTLTLDFGDVAGSARVHGVVEIDDELLVVTRFDTSTQVATLHPWGRGHRGTVAAPHAAGSMVTVRPRFPRKRVTEAINETIRASSPPLYAARDLEPITLGAWLEMGYDLPADTLRVLRVDATDVTAQFVDDRSVLRHWSVRSIAGTQQLVLREGPPFGTVQVTIAADPAPLTDPDDEFTVTGLPESCVDLVVYGALARLVMGVELARQQVSTPEAMARADKVPVQSGLAISRYYTALYQQRLATEQDRLNQQYPPTLLRRG